MPGLRTGVLRAGPLRTGVLRVQGVRIRVLRQSRVLGFGLEF